MAVRAFTLFGEITLQNKASAELHKVDKDVNRTAKNLGSLKGVISGSLHVPGGSLSSMNSALGTLSNISNTIQGIPVLGNLITGAVSNVLGPAKDLVTLGLSFNDLEENATLAFSVILKNGEKAKQLFADLKKFGVDSPIFKTSELITHAQKFLPYTGAGPELFSALKGAGALAAATGDMGNLPRIITAFQQIALKPKLTSEEPNQQLADAGVDFWGLLARARGQTKAEVMALTEKGQISGIGAFNVVLAQANRELGVLVDLMGQTRTGKQAQIDDKAEQLAGRATKSLHETWKGGQDRINAGLDGPQGAAIADRINAAGAAAGPLLLGGLDSLLDGSLLGKVKEATQNVVSTVSTTITGGSQSAYSAASGFAGNIEQGIKDRLGIQSPSTVGIKLGMALGEGFEVGLVGSLTDAQKRIAAKIVAIGRTMGVDPKLIQAAVATAWVESRFRNLKGGDRDSAGVMQQRPSIKNKDGSHYWGSYEQITDPDYAIERFYEEAKAKDKGESPGKLAQKVQRSAFPERYKEAMPLANQVINSLSVNGQPFSIGNPMPVTIVRQAIDAAEKANSLVTRDPVGGARSLFAAEDAKTAAVVANAVATAHEVTDIANKAKDPKVAEAIKGASEAVTNVTESLNKAAPAVEKLGESAKLTAEEQAKNREASDLKTSDTLAVTAAKKKAFSLENVSGDFQADFQNLLAGLGHDKPLNLGKQFLFGLVQDIQGLLAADLSASLTGSLFGTSKKEGDPLTGGLLSRIFGSLFGGHRASGGGMQAGSFYVAGEHGRELIAGPGHVYNARETQGMMSGAGSGEQRIMFAVGDKAVAEMLDANRGSHRGRRSMILHAKYMRKLQSVSYS